MKEAELLCCSIKEAALSQEASDATTGRRALRPLKMKSIRGMSAWRGRGRKDSRKQLIENNNNKEEEEEGGDGCDRPGCVFPQRVAPRVAQEELTRLLSALTCKDEGQSFVYLVQSYVSQCFPEAPADVDQNLVLHLRAVQQAVQPSLLKLGPALQAQAQELIRCFHRHTLQHLGELLQRVSCSHSTLLLMDWVLRSYLSQGLLGHPELQDMDPVEKVDLLLLTDWVCSAEDKLLLTVREEIRRSLANILQNVRNNEAHNELYVDTIQCINAVPAQALKFSAVLSERVQQVCFQELLTFLTQYAAEQGDFLCTQARMEQPGSKAFFQTLNNCRELKKYVQTKDGDRDVLSAAVATLESMEAFTLKLLKEIVAGMAKNRLKKYFKSENREFLSLLHEVQTLFSDVSGYPGLQTRVMDEAYELIAHLYLKRLVGTRARKLRTRWRPEVGPAVTEDVMLLHDVVSSMAPAVGQRNLLLLEVQDLLEQQDLEATKLTAARMQEQCNAASEDLELLPALLQWKGLSGAKTREVLHGLEDLPGSKHRPASWCCGCIGF